MLMFAGSWTYTAQQLNLFAEWDKAEIQNYTSISFFSFALIFYVTLKSLIF